MHSSHSGGYRRTAPGFGASFSIPGSFCLFFSGQSGAAGLDNDSILEFVFWLVSSPGLFSSQFNQFLGFRFNPADAWWGEWIMDPGLKVFTTFCYPFIFLFPLQLLLVLIYSCSLSIYTSETEFGVRTMYEVF